MKDQSLREGNKLKEIKSLNHIWIQIQEQIQSQKQGSQQKEFQSGEYSSIRQETEGKPGSAFRQSSKCKLPMIYGQSRSKWMKKKREEAEEKSRVESVEREVKRMLDIKNAQKWPLIVDDRSLWRKTKIAKWSNQGSFHFWRLEHVEILYNQMPWQNRPHRLYYTSVEAISRMREVP